MDRYTVISSDTHAGPRSEMYREYIDPEFREAFDRDLETALALRSIILESASEEQEKFRAEWEEETGDGGALASYDLGRPATPSSTRRAWPPRCSSPTPTCSARRLVSAPPAVPGSRPPGRELDPASSRMAGACA